MAAIKELKTMPNSEEARRILERLMKHCAPAIKRHKWNLVELKEFYPRSQGLLGVNVNRRTICVRLRSPSNKETFREWHEILGVMVHELTHMEISKHSSEFYTKMDELYTEVESDEASGLIDRFDGTNVNACLPSGPGRTLGGKSNKSMSREDSARERAAAAERRRQNQAIMGGGATGQAIGTRQKEPLFDLTTPLGRREAMVWAAMKRKSDNEACPAESQLELLEVGESDDSWGGNGGGGGAEAPISVQPSSASPPSSSSLSSSSSSSSAMPRSKRAKLASKIDAREQEKQVKGPSALVIDLTKSPRTPSEEVGVRGDTQAMSSRQEKMIARVEDDAVEVQGEAWPCPVCTYINRIDANVCDMCSYQFRSVANSAQKAGESESFDPFKPLISSGNGAWKGSKRARN
jgi:hypothetical protein